MATTFWRCESYEGPHTKFSTLMSAIAEPPMDPEASVTGAGGTHAMSCRESCRWVLTAIGKQRIELEARGHAADHLLLTELPSFGTADTEPPAEEEDIPFAEAPVTGRPPSWRPRPGTHQALARRYGRAS